MPSQQTINTEQEQHELDAMDHRSMARADYDFLNSHCPQCACDSIIMHAREVRVPKRILSTAEVARYFNDGVFAEGKKLYLPDHVHCVECSTITTFTEAA